MQLSQWTFFDFVFAIIILVSTGFALTKGLAREIVSLVALIGGFILAAFYYQVPAAWFKGILRTDALAYLVGFILIFMGCLLLGALVSFLINRMLKAAKLGWIDRLLGGIYGFLRGWAVASIIVLALVAFPLRQNVLARSLLAPYLLAGARAAVMMVPQELRKQFNEQYQKVLDILNEKRDPA